MPDSMRDMITPDNRPMLRKVNQYCHDGNRLFSARELHILLTPATWRVLAPGAGFEAEPSFNPRARAFARTHRHSHPHVEIVITLSGEVVYGCFGGVYRLVPGTVAVFVPGDDHQVGFGPASRRADQLGVGVMKHKFVARRVVITNGRETPEDTTIIAGHESDTGLNFATTIAHLCMPDGGVPSAVVRARVLALTGALTAAIVARGHGTGTVPGQAAETDRVIETIQEHLDATCGCNAKLDTLAEVSGFSKFHFMRLFQRRAGMTVHTYIDHCRRRKVSQLLKKGWSKKAIAAEIGFSCIQSFSRWSRQQPWEQ